MQVLYCHGLHLEDISSFNSASNVRRVTRFLLPMSLSADKVQQLICLERLLSYVEANPLLCADGMNICAKGVAWHLVLASSRSKLWKVA